MTSLDSIALHRTLGLLMAEASRTPTLGAELSRARREFFGVDALVQNPLQELAAETRFAEWYLLERESEVLGEVPVRHLARGMTEPATGHEALLDSVVSVYRVEGGNEIVMLRDLQDRTLHELERPSMLDLSPGDLLVGRLFASDGYSVPSAAVAVRPEADVLVGALESDLLSLELERRLTQVEFEHLLFRRWDAEVGAAEVAEPVEPIEQELSRLLATRRLQGLSVEEISEALRETPHPGSVIGPLLEEAAFDTDLDLEELRLLLPRLWNAHACAGGAMASGPVATPSPGPGGELGADAPGHVEFEEGLGERVARRIEEGRAQHEDMETVFNDVAEMLGEDLDDDELDEEGGLADSEARVPLFGGGDLEPLIGEFLWEEECEGGPEAPMLALLLQQQKQAPVPNLDLESLEASDLLRLLLRCYLESSPVERCERTQSAFEILERFCLWAERTQEYALSAVVGQCRERFVDELARLHRASLALSSGGEPPSVAPTDRPMLWRVLAADGRQLELVPLDDDRPVALSEPTAVEDLRSGDLMLAAAQLGAHDTAALTGMVVVLPAAAEALLG